MQHGCPFTERYVEPCFCISCEGRVELPFNERLEHGCLRIFEQYNERQYSECDTSGTSAVTFDGLDSSSDDCPSDDYSSGEGPLALPVFEPADPSQGHLSVLKQLKVELFKRTMLKYVLRFLWTRSVGFESWKSFDRKIKVNADLFMPWLPAEVRGYVPTSLYKARQLCDDRLLGMETVDSCVCDGTVYSYSTAETCAKCQEPRYDR